MSDDAKARYTRVLEEGFGGQIVAFSPTVARALGGINEALFIRQLIHWSRHAPDRWVYRTAEQFERETALTRRQQELVRAKLVKLGAIRERRRGIPASLQFQIDWSVLGPMIDAQVIREREGGSCIDEASEPEATNEETSTQHSVPMAATPPNGDSHSPKPGLTTHRNGESNNESSNESNEKRDNAAAAASVSPSKKLDLTGFAEWYAEYPLKKARPAAERAWAKLKPDERAAALDGLRAHVKAGCFPLDTSSSPYPATWLNGKRWGDALVPHFTRTRADEQARRQPFNGRMPWTLDDLPAELQERVRRNEEFHRSRGQTKGVVPIPPNLEEAIQAFLARRQAVAA